MLRRQLAGLALTATALAASGCGGSSTKATTTAATQTTAAVQAPTTITAKIATGTPLSRAQWIAKGDAICKRSKAKTAVLFVSKVADFPRVYPQIALYNRLEAAKLSKLVPPASDAQDWAQIVTDFEQHAQYVSEVARYVSEKRENLAGKPFELANQAIQQELDIAKRDGFKQCSIARA